jgi:hypothetical protein
MHIVIISLYNQYTLFTDEKIANHAPNMMTIDKISQVASVISQ